MLNNISKLLSPDLIKILMEMGHGDEIVLADGNFPAASTTNRLIRADGIGIPSLLSAILELFPIDTAVETPIYLMKVSGGDNYDPQIWKTYFSILSGSSIHDSQFSFLERHAFYDHAKTAYAIVATGEESLYANIIIKKGVVK